MKSRFVWMFTGALAGSMAAALAAPATWCLGFGSLGPIRAGMTVDEALPLADFRGLERKHAAESCWYLRYQSRGRDFDLMIIDGRVARIELKGASTLHTFSGAHIGSTEQELRDLYGAGLDEQPHKYDENGRTLTWRAPSADFGLRFETSGGKVTAIQTGAWEHVNYVEGCG